MNFFFFRTLREHHVIILACAPVRACTSEVECTNYFNSKCLTCLPGYYLNNTTPSECTGTKFHKFSFFYIKKNFEYFFSCDTFLACTPIDGCSSPITCSSLYDSRCSDCLAGFYIVNVIPTRCESMKFRQISTFFFSRFSSL